VKNIYLKFDNSVRWGSPDHFFHFMWGYLLPALNEIVNIQSDTYSKRVANKFFFRSCGPVMDRLINEMGSLYDCNFEIKETNVLNAEDHLTKIVVPRWDIWLTNYSVIKHIRFISTYLKLSSLNKMSLGNLLLPILKPYQFRSDFLASIRQVKTNTINKLDNSFHPSKINSYIESYLILKRSTQPEYYEKRGPAEVPTYGTARRELIGIEDAAEILRNKNISVKIFEPGKHSLSEQIKAFQNCKGIVGIRGAEFANLIWMKPESKVILIQPFNMRPPPIQKSLAKFLGLNYFEIRTKESKYPRLNADLISKYLAQ